MQDLFDSMGSGKYEYREERIKGIRSDNEIVNLEVVSTKEFVFHMVSEVGGVKYLYSQHLNGIIDSVKAKRGITFDPKDKEEVLELFKNTLCQLGFEYTGVRVEKL